MLHVTRREPTCGHGLRSAGRTGGAVRLAFTGLSCYPTFVARAEPRHTPQVMEYGPMLALAGPKPADVSSKGNAAPLLLLPICVALYVASFALPIDREEREYDTTGAALVRSCFQPMEYPVFLLLWPNLVLWGAALALVCGSWWPARCFGMLAVAGALLESFLLPSGIRGVGLGYWAWVGSMALLVTAAWIRWR